jgi:hypothetical protein
LNEQEAVRQRRHLFQLQAKAGIGRGAVFEHSNQPPGAEVLGYRVVGHVGQTLAARAEAMTLEYGAPHEPLAPFGGFKQSGIGREYGRGLETHLEAMAILV